MRFLAKLLGWLLALTAFAAAVQAFLIWDAARKDYARAEAQVAETIATGSTVVVLRDVPALRRIPDNLAEVERVTAFQARDTQLTDISVLADRTELLFVDVFGSRVSDLSPLAGLPELHHVVIGSTRIRDLEPLANLPALDRLDMNDVQIASLEPLTRADALSWVNLHGAYAEDGSQDHYTRLTEQVEEVYNGRAFELNYVPGDSWLWRVRMNRLAEDFGLPEPFPRGG